MGACEARSRLIQKDSAAVAISGTRVGLPRAFLWKLVRKGRHFLCGARLFVPAFREFFTSARLHVANANLRVALHPQWLKRHEDLVSGLVLLVFKTHADAEQTHIFLLSRVCLPEEGMKNFPGWGVA